MGQELEALHQERADMLKRSDGLRTRREDLLAQLKQVEEELQGVETTCKELDAREQNLNASMTRVSSELAQQLETVQEKGLVAACREHVLTSSVEASKAVEKQITLRAAAAAECLQGSQLNCQHPLVPNVTLETDQKRCRELQDLVAGWHEIVWGPGSVSLASNAAAVVALRAAHLKAVGLVEDAQREVQEDSEGDPLGLGLLGFGGGETAMARHLSRVAESYKIMRGQLCENLERLGELECIASGAKPSPPSPESKEPSSPKGLIFDRIALPSLESSAESLVSGASASLAEKRQADGGI